VAHGPGVAGVPRVRVVATDDEAAFGPRAADVAPEGRLHGVEVGVVVDVLEIDVGHDREVGLEFEQ
jgi:hypothetical protein